MKISKKTTATTRSVVTCDTRYKEPVEKIYSAIQCLGELAKDDVLAKEAIADLSVVMMDLKSATNR